MKMSKKVLSLLAVLALIGTMLSVMAVTTASADATNLIQNGDFNSETQLEHWRSYWRTREELINKWNSEHRYTTTKESYDGSSNVLGYNGVWDALYQEVAVTPGKTYQFSAWVKSQAEGINIAILEGADKTANELAGLMDAIYRSQSTDVYNYALVFAPMGHCGNWTRVAFEFTPSQPSVVVAYQDNSTGWAWADNFSIVETGDNKVANGDFETAVTGLSVGADAWQAQQGNANGSKYIHETGNGSMVIANYNTGADALYQCVPVTPGQTYTVSAKIKGGNAGTGFVALEGGSNINALVSDLYYYFAKGTMSTTVLNSYTSTGNIGTWTEISFNITPSKSTFVLGYANPTTTWAWIDDVSVTPKKVYPTEIVNGDFENGTTGWDFADSATGGFQVWDTQGVKGSGAVTWVGSNVWGGEICSQTIAVTPGKTYVFTAYAMNGSNSKVGIFGVADGSSATDAFGEAGTGNCLANVTPELTGSYQAVTLEFIPTQETITVAFQQSGGISNRATLFIDDVSVVAKNSDMAALGAQIRQTNNDLRFGFRMEAAGITKDADTHVRADLTTGSVMYIGGKACQITDFGVMLSTKAGAAEADLSVDATANTTVKVPAQKLYSVEDSVVTFYATLTKIPADKYDRVISTRAYVEYLDGTTTKYIYSDIDTASVDGLLAGLEQ